MYSITPGYFSLQFLLLRKKNNQPERPWSINYRRPGPRTSELLFQLGLVSCEPPKMGSSISINHNQPLKVRFFLVPTCKRWTLPFDAQQLFAPSVGVLGLTDQGLRSHGPEDFGVSELVKWRKMLVDVGS